MTSRRDLMQRLWMLLSVGIINGVVRGQADESGPHSIAEEVKDEEMTDTEVPQPGAPTLGGMQFWGDVCYFQGYRIQRHVFTGHFRLLDKHNRRYQSGTIEDCRKTLNELRAATNLKPDTRICPHCSSVTQGVGKADSVGE